MVYPPLNSIGPAHFYTVNAFMVVGLIWITVGVLLLAAFFMVIAAELEGRRLDNRRTENLACCIPSAVVMFLITLAFWIWVPMGSRYYNSQYAKLTGNPCLVQNATTIGNAYAYEMVTLTVPSLNQYFGGVCEDGVPPCYPVDQFTCYVWEGVLSYDSYKFWPDALIMFYAFGGTCTAIMCATLYCAVTEACRYCRKREAEELQVTTTYGTHTLFINPKRHGEPTVLHQQAKVSEREPGSTSTSERKP